MSDQVNQVALGKPGEQWRQIRLLMTGMVLADLEEPLGNKVVDTAQVVLCCLYLQGISRILKDFQGFNAKIHQSDFLDHFMQPVVVSCTSWW